MGGGAELDAWNKTGEWPRSPGWTPPPETIAANVAELAGECAAGSAKTMRPCLSPATAS